VADQTLPRDRFDADTTAAEVPGLDEGAPISIAGRVMLWRRMGGLVFGQVRDRSGVVQIALQRDRIGEDRFAAWRTEVSLGDFIGVTGERWATKTGEPTVLVDELTLLAESQRSLPDKWAGVTDPEARFRKRYLDLLMNDEARERMRIRSAGVTAVRRFMDDADFQEIETPVLLPVASGAAARPFVTYYNALDQDFYLRIAPETYLKRAVAGSLERVYEVAKCFRNEGLDPSHLQEFTMLEFYAAYWNYCDMAEFTHDLVVFVLTEVLGTTTVTRGDVTLDFGAPWAEVDYVDAVREASGIDVFETRDVDALRAAIEAAGIDEVGDAVSYAGLVDLLYKRTVRPGLIEPTLLLHHPAELVPLARRSDDDPRRLDMFQLVAGGWELVKAYSELVDPVEQRARMAEQAEMRAAGDDEAMETEDDFIDAMEHGMPPMAGNGLGIDRLVAFMTGAPSLREVVMFPAMRRLEQSGDH
jgi:lysyl-tRNA synthetase class 2